MVKVNSEKRRPIDKNIRYQLWQKYNKNTLVGECYVCERQIALDTFVVGHNIPVAKGGTDIITNLRPLCHGCNSSMGTITVEQYKKKHFGRISKTPKTTSDKKTTKTKKKTKNDINGKLGNFLEGTEIKEFEKRTKKLMRGFF